ncbi:Disease resistance protein [Melia azedarach]|uniref:Disease resistance protein n=1 Tax=Melia azedarach TaxID=155640 RepID=A0ACC1YKM1_MELAZ|nr:Disease resistance protein [Melia azedarach]
MHRKVQNFVNSINPSTFKFNASMRFKIKGMTSRLEQVCKDRIGFGLQLSTPAIGILGTSSSTAAHPRLPSSSVPTERVVFGRDEDKANILELVLSMDDAPKYDDNLNVIPIVGMAGIGKTTPARKIYNDKIVEGSNFDVKAWVCVSDVFDVMSVSRHFSIQSQTQIGMLRKKLM